MATESSIDLANSSGRTIDLYLEPWGEEIEMPASAIFTIVAKAEQSGSLQIDYGDGGIIVWGWPSSTLTIYCKGDEIGGLVSKHLPVPGVPEGQTVASLMRLIMGQPLKPEQKDR